MKRPRVSLLFLPVRLLLRWRDIAITQIDAPTRLSGIQRFLDLLSASGARGFSKGLAEAVHDERIIPVPCPLDDFLRGLRW